MTKGQIVDFILLAVLGGKFSEDSNVLRAEVEDYLPLAITPALKDTIWKEIKQEQNTANGIPPSPLGEQYYTPIIRGPLFDKNRNRYYFQLPKMPDVPYDWCIREAFPKTDPRNTLLRLTAAGSSGALEELLDGTAYWLERNDTGIYCWLFNPAQPICDYVFQMMVSGEGLDNNDEMNIPDDVLQLAVEIAKKHFREQRMGRADDLSNDKDTNEVNQPNKA